jgi:glycosyltransferase involved in cell wall biosynthesis
MARFRPRDKRRKQSSATDVVMVLENNRYPLDSRVRNEAESVADAGFNVEVLAPCEPERPRRETLAGVLVSRFPLYDGKGRLASTGLEYANAAVVVAAAVLIRLVRRQRGVLHFHNPPDLFFPLMWLAHIRGWSVVFDHHDDAAGMLRMKVGRATPAESILRWMRNRSVKAADLTVTTNETQAGLVKALARHLVVVRNGPPDWFMESQAHPPTGRVRLVFLGEIGLQDRVDHAVAILAMIVHHHRIDAELLVVGDGPERESVEARAMECGMGDRLHITGWVPYERVPGLLASGHVGLDTAPPTEVNQGSTMIKIAEYLSVGLPVVATALRETRVTGGVAVLTVDDGAPEGFVAPVVRLAADGFEWRRRSDLARVRSAELRWSTQAERLVAAYTELFMCS